MIECGGNGSDGAGREVGWGSKGGEEDGEKKKIFMIRS